MIKIFTATNSKQDWIGQLERTVNAFEADDRIVVTGRDVSTTAALNETSTHERMTIVVSYVTIATPTAERLPYELARNEQACNVDGEVFRTDDIERVAALAPLADHELAVCARHIIELRRAAVEARRIYGEPLR